MPVRAWNQKRLKKMKSITLSRSQSRAAAPATSASQSGRNAFHNAHGGLVVLALVALAALGAPTAVYALDEGDFDYWAKASFVIPIAEDWRFQFGQKFGFTDEARRLDHQRRLRGGQVPGPVDDNGNPSNRLELLTKVNNISHEAAHDAMSDVYATIAVARLIREKQPRRSSTHP